MYAIRRNVYSIAISVPTSRFVCKFKTTFSVQKQIDRYYSVYPNAKDIRTMDWFDLFFYISTNVLLSKLI